MRCRNFGGGGTEIEVILGYDLIGGGGWLNRGGGRGLEDFMMVCC